MASQPITGSGTGRLVGKQDSTEKVDKVLWGLMPPLPGTSHLAIRFNGSFTARRPCLSQYSRIWKGNRTFSTQNPNKLAES